MPFAPSALLDIQRLQRSAFGGGLVWLVLFLVPLSAAGPEAEVARLLLLAVLVTVPLFLALLATPSPDGTLARPYRAAARLQPFAAILAAGAFAGPAGWTAAALTVPWGVFTGLVALEGVRRLRDGRQAKTLDTAEVVTTVGMVYLPGGAVWLFMARLGFDPGYGSLIVLLTAVHFHYTAFLAPQWAGRLGRAIAERRPGAMGLYRVLGPGLLLGTPLVALGFARIPALETFGVLVLTSSAFGLGLLGLGVAARTEERSTQVMLGVSAGSLCLAMVWAFLYRLGPSFGGLSPTIEAMIPLHGWVNGIGFALWGALAWRRLFPTSSPNEG